MNEEWWERPVCWLCDFWWLLLLLLLGGLTAFFTRSVWMPAPPPTRTPLPSATFTPVPTVTLQPTPTQTPSPVPSATRVESLGTGDVQLTLTWNSVNDLDLWVTDPQGTLIYYNNRSSSSGGELDVDANPGCQNLTAQPVENIYWPSGKAPSGEYVVSVNYFQQCQSLAETAFTLRVLVDGQVQTFSGSLSVVGDTREMYRFRR
ncbi:MAG: hypothetical protein OHK0031_01070 [Anaerolineales bacterium]